MFDLLGTVVEVTAYVAFGSLLLGAISLALGGDDDR